MFDPGHDVVMQAVLIQGKSGKPSDTFLRSSIVGAILMLPELGKWRTKPIKISLECRIGETASVIEDNECYTLARGQWMIRNERNFNLRPLRLPLVGWHAGHQRVADEFHHSLAFALIETGSQVVHHVESRHFHLKLHKLFLLFNVLNPRSRKSSRVTGWLRVISGSGKTALIPNALQVRVSASQICIRSPS